ncbi:SLC13 family permease [Endozoicomonas ascidiicola]|uniref:SLC13 family permease n=1 Tax=Endozoicomonas ascidiicola TaxID=1698521 RepID=UPI000B2FADD1|nr:DASS family sodium-coupled anion symporter [Endozoicomonas ascidiicola]
MASAASVTTENSEHQVEGSDRHPMFWVFGLIAGVGLQLLTLLTEPPAGMTVMAWHCAGLALMMAVFWAVEILPTAITALFPLIFAPMMGINSIDGAAAPYAHPVIFLFMGGFAIGLAMERWHLHSRVALNIMLLVGAGEKRLVLGFMTATALISMWVSNAATTIMMLPIGLSVVAMIRDQGRMSNGFPIALLLAIAYGASIGGFGTLIGSPPNALLVAFLQDQYDIQIEFARWLIIGVPASLLMLIVTGLWLGYLGYNLCGKENQVIQQSIRAQRKDLGKMSMPEKIVAVIFCGTAIAWVTRPWLIDLFPGLLITDAAIALIATILLFVLPSNLRKLQFLMSWNDMRRLPWDVLLLFGGGLSLASMIRRTGLSDWIAGSLSFVGDMPELMVIAMVVAIIIFLTEVTSNTATTAAFLPPLGALATSFGMSPVVLAIPAAIAASCAFMLPVATPPNAIVYGAGMLPIRHMIRSGLVLNLVGIAIITLLSKWLIGWVV